MKALTLRQAKELIGKVIEWSAPSAEGNSPYGGKAIIKEIKESYKPLVCTTIEGDDLSYAVCEEGIDIDYSDYGRGVSYRLATMTLLEFADHINSVGEWKLYFNDIIEQMGWADETGEDRGICSDGVDRLILNDNGVVVFED